MDQDRPDTRPNYGLYVYSQPGTHNGATWIRGIDAALPAFVDATEDHPDVMLTDSGDLAVIHQADGQVLFARHALIQAVPARRALLKGFQLSELQCCFCREVFLPSRKYGEGEAWECEQHIAPCCSDACWERSLGAEKTVRLKVELRAFGDGAIREVKIPAKLAKGKDLRELAFQYGQNDKQPQQLPSVSVWDIVLIGETRWKIVPTGFELFLPAPVVPEAEPVAYDERDQT